MTWGVSAECRRTRLLPPLRSFGLGRSSLGSLPALCRQARLRAACWTSRTSWRLRPPPWSGSGIHHSLPDSSTVGLCHGGLAVATATKMPRRAFIMTVMDHFPHLAEAIQASLRDEADRARFYAQMLVHRFHDPVTADQLWALAVDLERQAAALAAAQRSNLRRRKA